MHLRAEAGLRHAQAHWQRRPDLTIKLMFAGPVHGRLVDAANGTAVAGATVHHHHGYCKGCVRDEAVTDANGAFVLPAVPRAQDCVFGFAADGYPNQHERLRLPGRGDAIAHTFRLARGAVLAGRCVDLATRRPIAGVELRINGELVATAAADGAFRALVLPSAAGIVDVEFTAAGYCRTTTTIDVPQEDPAAEFPLPRVAAVRGRVTTADGVPIAKARVRSTGPTGEPVVPGLRPQTRVQDDDWNLLAHTGADGTFELRGLVPGATYHLRSGHDDFTMPREHMVGYAVDARDDAPPIVIVLEPKPRVDGFGTVVGTFRCNGVPGSAALRWEASGRHGRGGSDANGAFRLERVPAGRVDVTAVAAADEHAYGEPVERVTWRGHVDVRAGDTAQLDIELVVELAPIAGTVRFADGAPMVRGTVYASAGALRRWVSTDADGAFEVVVPRAISSWSIVASGGAATAAPGDRDVRLVATRSHRVRLRVRDENGARIDASIHRGAPGDGWMREYWNDAPDPEGYRAFELPAGDHEFLVCAEGFVPALRAERVRGDIALDVTLVRGTKVTLRRHRDAPAGTELDVELVDALVADLRSDERMMLMLPGRRARLGDADHVVHGVGPGAHRLVTRDPHVALSPATVVVGTDPVVVDVNWARRAK